MLTAIVQQKPALSIPEGVFYDDIENYSIFIESK